jgi:hypothetical protein
MQPVDFKDVLVGLDQMLNMEVKNLTNTYDLNVKVRYTRPEKVAWAARGLEMHHRFAYDIIMALLKSVGSQEANGQDIDGAPEYFEPRVWQDSDATFGYGREIELISWLDEDAENVEPQRPSA